MAYVWMKNSTLPDNDPVQVVESAFEDSWKHKGWEKCDAPPEQTQADLDATLRPAPEDEPDAKVSPLTGETDDPAADEAPPAKKAPAAKKTVKE